MSGPKGGSYQVETAHQRETRMLRDARADYTRAAIAWDTAAARMAAVGSIDGAAVTCARPAPVTGRANSATYRQAAHELSAAAEAATALAASTRERAAANHHAQQLARMIGNIDAHPGVGTAGRRSRWEASRAADTPTASTSVDRDLVDRERTARRVQSRLEALRGLEHDATRVDSLIGDITAAGTEGRIDLLIGELDILLAEARAAADRDVSIGQTRGELCAMQARIADLGDASARPLRQRIAALIDASAAEVPDDLAGAVATLIAESDAEADRQHVVQVMNAALVELGYATGPHFSTDLSGAQATAYARSESSQYGIKVRLETDTQRFTAQAVKSDATLTSADEDVAAEREFCSTLERMVEMASREGVRLDVDIKTVPGAYAVQRIADSTLTSIPARRVSRTGTAQRRERRVQ